MWEQERVGGGSDELEPGTLASGPETQVKHKCKEQADKLGSGGGVAH